MIFMAMSKQKNVCISKKISLAFGSTAYLARFLIKKLVSSVQTVDKYRMFSVPQIYACIAN